MKRGLCTAIVLSVMLLASAAPGADWNFNFHVTGTILNHPAQYSGIFTSGADGTLEFTLIDTNWPDPSNPDVRFAYIWDNYFKNHYYSTPGSERWWWYINGTFSMATTNAPLGYNGTCQGKIRAYFTIRDLDADGILDVIEEKFGETNTLDGVTSRACTDAGTGEMNYTKGTGALNSNGFSFTYPPGVDVLDGWGNLTLTTCEVATEPGSWGGVKSLYK